MCYLIIKFCFNLHYIKSMENMYRTTTFELVAKCNEWANANYQATVLYSYYQTSIHWHYKVMPTLKLQDLNMLPQGLSLNVVTFPGAIQDPQKVTLLAILLTWCDTGTVTPSLSVPSFKNSSLHYCILLINVSNFAKVAELIQSTFVKSYYIC